MKTAKIVVTQSHFRHINTDLDLIHLPIIELKKLEYNPTILEKNYDWIIITSKNTVTFFLNELKQLQFKHIASIGKTTTEALKEAGFKVDFEPSDYTQEGFKKEFVVNVGDKVIYPASKNKRSIMRDYFKAEGAELTEVALYKPVANDKTITTLRKILQEIDGVTFSSPSGVHAFMRYFTKENLNSIVVTAIGHVTKNVLNEYGVESLMPQNATLDSMIKRIEKEFQNEF